MSSRIARACGLVVAGFASVAAAAGPTKAELEFDTHGEVQIAPDGSVSDYRIAAQSQLDPKIAELVDRNVRAWHFDPVLVDGKPVVAKTAIHLHLNAQPADEAGRYIVRIARVDFGEPRRNANNAPPHYPPEAVYAHLGARVMLALRLDENGAVIAAEPYQTSLDARASSEMEAERWRKLFERASVSVARTWHYDLSEKINGKPIGAHVLVPIVYSVTPGNGPADGAWKAYVPGPLHAAPWMRDTQTKEADLAALGDGRALPLDSHFHLKDDVVGKAL